MSCMHYIYIVAVALQYQRTHLDVMTTQSTSLLVEDVPYMFHLVCGSTCMSCTHLHVPDGACMKHFPPKVMYFCVVIMSCVHSNLAVIVPLMRGLVHSNLNTIAVGEQISFNDWNVNRSFT